MLGRGCSHGDMCGGLPAGCSTASEKFHSVLVASSEVSSEWSVVWSSECVKRMGNSVYTPSPACAYVRETHSGR